MPSRWTCGDCVTCAWSSVCVIRSSWIACRSSLSPEVPAHCAVRHLAALPSAALMACSSFWGKSVHTR